MFKKIVKGPKATCPIFFWNYLFSQTAGFIGLFPTDIFLLRKPVAESFGTNRDPLQVLVKLLQLIASHSSTIFDLFLRVDEISELDQ